MFSQAVDLVEEVLERLLSATTKLPLCVTMEGIAGREKFLAEAVTLSDNSRRASSVMLFLIQVHC